MPTTSASPNRLEFPVYRQGIVLGSTEELREEEAERVAARIAAESRSFVTQIRAALKRAGASDIQTSDEIRRTKTAPHIVDMPIISFAIDGHRMETRCCVTVCRTQRQSKSWVRINMLDHESAADIHVFFGRAEALGTKLNDSVRQWYGELLNKTLNKADRIALNEVYRIHIRIASTNEPAVETYFKAAYATPYIVRGPAPSLPGSETVLSVLNEIDPEVRALPPFAPEKEQDETKRQIAYVCERGLEPKMPDDDVHAVLVVRYNKKSVTFSGVGYDAILNEPAMPHTRALSHIVSGELSTEYGELF